MSEPSRPTQPTEMINDVCLGDDSFDDEFRLLESTLTDIKENDFHDESTKNEAHLNDSGVFSLDLVDITPAENSNVFNMPKASIPLKLQGTNLMPKDVINCLNIGLPTDIISSTDLKFTQSLKIGLCENFEYINDANCSPLPTTQQFMPTGKCNEPLTNLIRVSISENLEFKSFSPNSVSNCDIISGTMQSSSKPLCSGKDSTDNKFDGLTHCNTSVVNVAPCDSLFVEIKDETFQVVTDDPAQKSTEVKLNASKKVLPGELDCLDLKCKESDTLDRPTNEAAFALESENKNLEQNQVIKMSQSGESKFSSNIISENIRLSVKDFEQNDIVMQSAERKEATPLGSSVKNRLEPFVVDSTDGSPELKESSELLMLDSDTKFEDSLVSTSRTNKRFFDDEGQPEDKIAASDIKKESSTFVCSTPIVSNLLKDNVQDSIELRSDQMTPLNTNYLKSKMNQKRKNLCLERIDEEVDDTTDGCSDKRLKLGSPTTSCESKIILQKSDVNVSSSMPCFEPPAKSILKKWHPSGISRDSFLIVDECGESESEETCTPIQESIDQTTVDDFEVACRSLAEELLMSSSNYETLEKYNSHVQLDNQIDDQKFNEALQELNDEMDEKSFLSYLKPIEESKFVNTENFTDFSKELSNNDTENKENPSPALVHESEPCDEKVILDEVKTQSIVSGADSSKDSPETSASSQSKKIKCENENIVTTNRTHEKLAIDEEDVLLDEVVKVEQKQYVYFEYVSSDPKENEDNYNPEWQKLEKLTTDEERYKAVRVRWRSLVPPDPNRDLTCRQWRKKNNKPPLNIPSLNNNQRMVESNEKNQLCTAVFERKIAKLLQDLQMRRMQIMDERKMSFVELAQVQDDQQRRVIMRGTDQHEMGQMQRHHIQECINLKDRFDMLLKEETKNTEAAVMTLKSACNEVLSFQKFYKGVGKSNREVFMYMSEIQVEELMETEEMLEQYPKYYQ